MKKAIMYGAGSIGRGYMAELFCKSGYETVFVDIDREIINALNDAGEYPIRIINNEKSHEIIVNHVSGICAEDTNKVTEAIKEAYIIATSVGKTHMPEIALVIANGLMQRWKEGNNSPVNILVCENMIKANEYLRELLSDNILQEYKEKFDSLVGTVETTIGRNVPVMTPDLYGDNRLRVRAEDYYPLPVEANCFKGEIPDIKHMVLEEDFSFPIRQKLFMYNMTHAIVGFLGMRRGLIRLADAIEQIDIRYVVSMAFKEISLGMARQYKRPLDEIQEFCDNLMYRYNNKELNIVVPRLAYEPDRKLGPEDRLVGAARLCMDNGVKPAYIAIGIAAGYSFVNPNDESSNKLQDYIRSNGIKAAILKYSGIDEKHFLYNIVLRLYDAFENKEDLSKIILLSERYARGTL